MSKFYKKLHWCIFVKGTLFALKWHHNVGTKLGFNKFMDNYVYVSTLWKLLNLRKTHWKFTATRSRWARLHMVLSRLCTEPPPLYHLHFWPRSSSDLLCHACPAVYRWCSAYQHCLAADAPVTVHRGLGVLDVIQSAPPQPPRSNSFGLSPASNWLSLNCYLCLSPSYLLFGSPKPWCYFGQTYLTYTHSSCLLIPTSSAYALFLTDSLAVPLLI